MLGGTNVPSVPTIKANLTGSVYTKWLIAKASIGNGREISNAKALERLVTHYNREKGMKLI